MAEPDWFCPLCALVKMAYGTTCTDKETCEHLGEVHITGQFYLKPTEDTVEGTGISRISDE